MNPSFAGLVGYSPEDLTSLNPEVVEALLHPLDRDLVLQRWGERLDGKSPPSQYRFRLIRKDGTVIWVEACASRVEYRGKRAVQAVLTDVTESRRKDEQLRRLYEDFHEVEEQTAELRRLNEQLLSDPEQRKEGEQALGERLAELEGTIREVEEVNAALRGSRLNFIGNVEGKDLTKGV